MRFAATFRILGLLLMIFSISMFPPLVVSYIFHDTGKLAFIIGFILTFSAGLILWIIYRRYHTELKIRDGFLVVALFWFVLSLFGTIPLIIGLYPHMNFTSAMFETVSGLTTTGGSVLTRLDDIPRSVLYYRQQLHLLGGMGIIVLAVAILPMLGVGGMQLYRAETVGPLKTTKLRPRMTQTAKALWILYAGLVIACALSYWLAGMKPLDAIGESFSTLSTGGFTMHDNSFGYYHSQAIDAIAVIFMLLGATNFSLHFQFLKRRKFSIYSMDPEFRAYLFILLSATLIIVFALIFHHEFQRGTTFLNVLFTVVSVGTTTGFSTVNFNIWPTFTPYLLMFVAILGGCGGSTAGGIKIIRCLLLKEQGAREMKQLIHPQGVYLIHLGKETLPENIMQGIWGFISVYLVLFITLLLILLATGLDMRTAFGALASCISNTGAAIGQVYYSFAHVSTLAKWDLIFAMLAGRLEIFTILVLFAPGYWRK